MELVSSSLKAGVLLSILTVVAGSSHAQMGSARFVLSQQQSATALSPDDGLAIIGAALDFQHVHRRKPDCSHLVHAIYGAAGFTSPYAKSLDLYRGTAEGFVEVTAPQPGDLIVWPRHVGIVVNPAQNSFYSSLRSGLGIDYYDATYWKQKGVPRFYRFLVTTVVKLQPRTDPLWIGVGD